MRKIFNIKYAWETFKIVNMYLEKFHNIKYIWGIYKILNMFEENYIMKYIYGTIRIKMCEEHLEY